MVSLYDIQVFTPRTLEETLELLDRMGGRAKIIAGGTDLIIQMRHGLTPRRDLINIYGLEELRYIREEYGTVRIGALTTFSEIAASESIRRHAPFLAEAANTIGSIQIMNKATIGGNLVNASPAADSLPPLYVLDASVKIVGRKGERTVSIERFYKGYKKMDIAPDEILAEISFKIPDADGRGLFFKHGLRLGDAISVVNGAVWMRIREGVIEDAKISLGAVAPTVVRARRSEEILRGKTPEDENLWQAARAVIHDISPIDDVRGSAGYRAEMAVNYVYMTLKRLVTAR